MGWTYLAIGVALAFYTVTFMVAATQRRRSGIKAPATSGDAMLERALRVQQNTVEQLVVFIPACWIFGLTISSAVAAALAVVWVVGRAIYARDYLRAPDSRGTGFVIAFFPQMILLGGAILGAAISVFRSI